MKFTINGVDFHVNWAHDPNFETEISKGMTTCCINVNDFDTVRNAFCSKKDAFCRQTGRKVSFAKAVINLTDDAEIREKLWDEYFKKWPLK